MLERLRQSYKGWQKSSLSYEILGESGQVKQIPVSELYDFKNHPFQVKEDKDFSELLESIRENGVLMPCIARSRSNGGYELISGHRRKKPVKNSK